MSNPGFLSFFPSCFSCISWKSFCWSISLKSLSWKSIFVETHFVESHRNNSYTQLFSGSVLWILQLPLWLVGRPWYVRSLQRLGKNIFLSVSPYIGTNKITWCVSLCQNTSKPLCNFSTTPYPPDCRNHLSHTYWLIMVPKYNVQKSPTTQKY